jgi:hypothetical protein
MVVCISLSRIKNESQQSVNDVWSSILDNQRSLQLYHTIGIAFVALIGKNVSNDITTASYK